jgi:hypothetical protein
LQLLFQLKSNKKTKDRKQETKTNKYNHLLVASSVQTPPTTQKMRIRICFIIQQFEILPKVVIKLIIEFFDLNNFMNEKIEFHFVTRITI